jgi:hypothetical protein
LLCFVLGSNFFAIFSLVMTAVQMILPLISWKEITTSVEVVIMAMEEVIGMI